MKVAMLKKGEFATTYRPEPEMVTPVKVLSVDAQRISYQILTGKSKGKSFSGRYDSAQEVIAFKTARAAIAHADKLNRESSVKRSSRNKRGKNSHDKIA